MATPEEKQPSDIGGIKKLGEKLYGRAVPKEIAERRHKLHDTYRDVAAGWAVPTQKVSAYKVGYTRKPPSLLYALFLFSLVFFALSFALAAYFFFSGGNIVSNDRIDVLITGPIAVPAGEELTLQVEIVNRNSAPLLLSDLLVEYPEGTRAPIDRKTEQLRTLEEFGTIEPGGRVKTTARGVLFGEENEVKDITLAFEYRIEGSNAYLVKEVTYAVTLSSAPIVLAVRAPPEMVSGQEITLVADVASNATAPIRNVLLKAEYPFGFAPQQSTPEPTLEDRYWFIGDLMPGDKKTVTIKGRLVAQNAEERAFRFQIGSRCEGNDREVCPVFGELSKIVVVKRPFIATTLTVNGSEANPFAVNRGGDYTADVDWTNTLPNRLIDIEIEAKLAGPALDRNTVKANQGAYRSVDDTVFFNKNTNTRLAEMDPGDELHVSFDFGSIPLSANYGLENPYITIELVVRGTRFRESDESPETVSTEMSREVRIQSDVFVTGYSQQTVGSIQNFGPFPPRPDQETSYTITWAVQNSANDVANAYVVGRLPVNVRFSNVVSPSGERIAFNPDTRLVRWDIGNLPHGTGYATAAREASFQVVLLPSVTQVNAELPLVQNTTLSGVDRYAGSTLSGKARDISTRTANDPEATDNSYFRVAP